MRNQPNIKKLIKPMLFLAFSLNVIFANAQTASTTIQLIGKSYVTPKSIKSIDVNKAAVACGHPLASKVGLEIMKQGGNAIDAGIAVQLALAVVYPRAGNIGGGGFLVYRNATGTEINTLDFRERAPSAASRDMYLDSNGNVLTEKCTRGALASGIPGTIDGCYRMFLKYSKLKSWKKLVQPALNLAQNGFTITETEAKRLNDVRATFAKFSTVPKTALIKPENEVWKADDILIQPELAQVLKDVRDKNVKGFYEGRTAQLIVAEMQRGGGLITFDDLKNYAAVWRKPLIGAYRGYGIIGMPPPSSGGIALMQLLTLSEKFNLQNKPFHSSESIHFIVEAERRVFADRATHLGDADFYKVPVKGLLDKNYIINRFSTFDPEKATPSKSVAAGEIAQVSEQTTHISIVDAQGNAVSITTTLNDNYGCRTIVGGAGFILNNEMDDFSAKAGVPNLYGAVGGEANSIKPLKRPLSSMTPTIVTKDNKLFLVTGTPGGTTIITSVFQVITNVIDYKMTATEATQAPRFHSQWLPDVIMIEKGGVSDSVIAELKLKGHTFVERGGIGLVETILVKPNGTLEAVADKRSDDDVEGY